MTHLPLEADAGCLKDTPGRLGQLRPGPVAGNQGDAVGHRGRGYTQRFPRLLRNVDARRDILVLGAGRRGRFDEGHALLLVVIAPAPLVVTVKLGHGSAGLMRASGDIGRVRFAP